MLLDIVGSTMWQLAIVQRRTQMILNKLCLINFAFLTRMCEQLMCSEAVVGGVVKEITASQEPSKAPNLRSYEAMTVAILVVQSHPFPLFGGFFAPPIKGRPFSTRVTGRAWAMDSCFQAKAFFRTSAACWARNISEDSWAGAVPVASFHFPEAPGLSMEDPTPPLDTPLRWLGPGLKTRFFEGPKSLGSQPLGSLRVKHMRHGAFPSQNSLQKGKKQQPRRGGSCA